MPSSGIKEVFSSISSFRICSPFPKLVGGIPCFPLLAWFLDLFSFLVFVLPLVAQKKLLKAELLHSLSLKDKLRTEVLCHLPPCALRRILLLSVPSSLSCTKCNNFPSWFRALHISDCLKWPSEAWRWSRLDETDHKGEVKPLP